VSVSILSTTPPRVNFFEVYNYRVVQEFWLSRNPHYGSWMKGMDRDDLLAFLDTVPLPREITNRLIWEPYLT
jgi:hypothetical protein